MALIPVAATICASAMVAVESSFSSVSRNPVTPYKLPIVDVNAVAVPTKASDVLAVAPADTKAFIFACSLSSSCCHVNVFIKNDLTAP